MTYIKKTTSDKLKDYLDSCAVPYSGKQNPAFVLTDDRQVRAACIYEEKEHYVKLLTIVCPDGNAIFIDAIVRAAVFGPFEAGIAYALYNNQHDAVLDALKKMTRFKKVLPAYDYAVGVAFEEKDVDETTYLCDLFDLFTNKNCGGDA